MKTKNTMKTARITGGEFPSKILATGGFYSKRDCPPPSGVMHHRFDDVSSRPSGHPGERLVTMKCRYCGGMIVDCPSMSGGF